MSRRDFVFQNHGSLWIVFPQNKRAEEHLLANISDEAQMWGKNGVVVEPRYVSDLAAGLQDAGFSTNIG